MKQRLFKGFAVTLAIGLFILTNVTALNMNLKIYEAQETLIDQNFHLIDLQEKIIKNINSVYVEQDPGTGVKLSYDIHVEMWHYDQYGNLKAYSRRAGVLTDTGKEWIEDQLGDASVAEGDYIGLSNNTGAPSSAWSILPDEIDTGAMDRAQGTYVSDGTGIWNITHTFSPTESNATRLVGLYYSDNPASSLIASDTITVVNYANGDSVQIRWRITVT